MYREKWKSKSIDRSSFSLFFLKRRGECTGKLGGNRRQNGIGHRNSAKPREERVSSQDGNGKLNFQGSLLRLTFLADLPRWSSLHRGFLPRGGSFLEERDRERERA